MKWEYYRLAIVETYLEDALNDLGQEGWELVSIMAESRLFQGFQCLLKRPTAATAAHEAPPTASRLTLHQTYEKAPTSR